MNQLNDLKIKFRLTKELILHTNDEKISHDFNFTSHNHSSVVQLDGENNTISIESEYSCKLITENKLTQMCNKKDSVEYNESKELNQIHRNLNSLLSEFDLLLRSELDRIYNKKIIGKKKDFQFFSQINQDWVSFSLSNIYFGYVTTSVAATKYINKELANNISNNLKNGEKPYLATYFLDLALNSIKDPNIKWVVGTIALEIGIKEAIIRINPNLETLFLEIQSPALFKMYKHILKSLTDYESPFYKDAQKGAEIRNKIVHRPEKIDIEHQDVINYLRQIYHTLTHLKKLVRHKNHGAKKPKYSSDIIIENEDYYKYLR